MKTKKEIKAKIKLIKFALLHGNIQKKSDILVLRGQLSVLEWVLREDAE